MSPDRIPAMSSVSVGRSTGVSTACVCMLPPKLGLVKPAAARRGRFGEVRLVAEGMSWYDTYTSYYDILSRMHRSPISELPLRTMGQQKRRRSAHLQASEYQQL